MCDIKFTNGQTMTKPVDICKEQYFDEYTSETLPDALVGEAMVNELTYFSNVTWEIASADEVKQDTRGGGGWWQMYPMQ